MNFGVNCRTSSRFDTFLLLIFTFDKTPETGGLKHEERKPRNDVPSDQPYGMIGSDPFRQSKEHQEDVKRIIDYCNEIK
jgi:hypothetical protein